MLVDKVKAIEEVKYTVREKEQERAQSRTKRETRSIGNVSRPKK